MRQSDAGRGCGRPGGKGVQTGDCFFDQQSQQKVGIKPSAGEIGVFGGQPVDVKDGFQALDDELDLPSHPIECADALDWELVAFERRQQDDVI